MGLGEALISLEAVDEAVRELEAADAIEPKVNRTLAALARAYRLQGRGGLATETARRAEATEAKVAIFDQVRFEVKLLARDPRSLRDRALEALERGDHRAAIPTLQQLQDESSDDPWVNFQLARAHAGLGKPDVAISFLERSAEKDPDSATVHLQLGSLHAKTGDFDLAFHHLNRSAELEPQQFPAHALLGNLLSEDGQHADAAWHYRLALDAHQLEAESAAIESSKSDAPESFEDPDVAETHARLGTALGRTGDFEGARRELAHAVELGRADTSTLRNLASAHMRLGSWAEAAQSLERALQAEPRNAAVMTQLGRCLERQGRTTDAIARYEQAAAIEPRGPAAKRLKELETTTP